MAAAAGEPAIHRALAAKLILHTIIPAWMKVLCAGSALPWYWAAQTCDWGGEVCDAVLGVLREVVHPFTLRLIVEKLLVLVQPTNSPVVIAIDEAKTADEELLGKFKSRCAFGDIPEQKGVLGALLAALACLNVCVVCADTSLNLKDGTIIGGGLGKPV